MDERDALSDQALVLDVGSRENGWRKRHPKMASEFVFSRKLLLSKAALNPGNQGCPSSASVPLKIQPNDAGLSGLVFFRACQGLLGAWISLDDMDLTGHRPALTPSSFGSLGFRKIPSRMAPSIPSRWQCSGMCGIRP